MESLARLMLESENEVMAANSVKESLDGIRSTVARFEECVNDQHRTIDEYKKKHEPQVCNLNVYHCQIQI